MTESPGARTWAESYLGGSPEREEELFRRFADQILEVQRRNLKRGGGPIRRAFHAKLLAGIGDARVEISRDLRPELRTGMLSPGATYPAIVRLSSASGMIQPDDEDDHRGIAVRIHLEEGVTQDLLMTNAPASHARDARQFMVTALATAGGRRLGAIPRLVFALGPREALRILRALRRAASRPVQSLATETFWSRGPFAIGPHAVKLILRPEAQDLGTPAATGSDSLRTEFVRRLQRDDIRYVLQVQHFLDERRTPIEDGAVEWSESDAPPETIAEVILPRSDLDGAEAAERERSMDELTFSPWNAGGGFSPIGGLNRARRLVYPASAGLRARTTSPDYIYGNGLISEKIGSARYYYSFDAFGSVANVTTSNGGLAWSYWYDPWGGQRPETSSATGAPINYMQFDGEYHDNTGAYNLRARIYQPGLGTFQQSDPASSSSSYAFADDRPTVMSDPSGMVSLRGVLGGMLDWFNENVNPGYAYLQSCFGSDGTGTFGSWLGHCGFASSVLAATAVGLAKLIVGAPIGEVVPDGKGGSLDP